MSRRTEGVRITGIPRGSIYTTIMELGPQNQNHNGYGLLGPNSIIVVYTDSLGLFVGLKGFAVKDFMRLGIPCRGWVVWGCKA